MIKFNDISYNIGERTLFSGVNVSINPHDRFGLVGANGTGKTTLLRLIMGEVSPSRGSLDKPVGINIGYLPQEEIVLRGSTLIEEVLRDYNHHVTNLSGLRKRISENPHSNELLKEYEIAEANFYQIGGYSYESEAYKIISGLGFTREDYKKNVQEFSSGWQMRIVLARLLLNKPHLLLLDEPTNHLDIESIQWLENYLLNFEGAMVMVSHDRYFLDKILQTPKGVNGIWEIDFGRLRKYRTNYTGYLQESKMRKQRLIQLAKNQARRIKEIEEFIMCNRANKSKAKLVKSREKYLARIERVQVEKERKKIRVRFPIEEVHSQGLVKLNNISKSYNSKLVFKEVDLLIERGDKIALIGKNGAGKSTLCRIIAGGERPTSGTRKASEKLKIGAFSHEILLQLHPRNTVLEEISADASPGVNQNIRKYLGLFLFSGDDVFKKIEVLSGGEKTRLVILKAMLEPSNLLILDEPTYHLDRDSRDAIKQAIDSYGGTVILVTHDRDLITSFATRIIELKECGLYDYAGDFNYYLWKRKNNIDVKTGKKKRSVKESLVDKLKKQILQKEERRNKLRELFSGPLFINNPHKANKLFEEYQRLTEEIDELESKLSSENN
jgi:ATP-binding cassette subfamily F protein 3